MPSKCVIGRILTALGRFTVVVMLFGHAFAFAQSEGSIDSSWNPPGQPYLDLSINKWVAIATQPDGKVVVQGQEYVDRRIVFFLRRFNRDGSLDTSFGSGGRTSLDFQSLGLPNLVIDALGRIYLDGENTTSQVIDGVMVVQREVLLARYSANGALDGTFGSGGLSRLPDLEFGTVQQIALQPDGKLLLIDNAGTREQETAEESG